MGDGILDLTAFLQGGPSPVPSAVTNYTPISFPVDMPATSGIRQIIWSRDEVRGVSESPFTLQRQLFRHQGERWRATIVFPQMLEIDAVQWEGLLMQLDGGFGSFLFGDVFHTLPAGTALGAPKVQGGGQVGRLLVTSGWVANQADLYKAGDWLQIGQRLYRCVQDASSDDDGSSVLNIWPRLRESPPDQTPITIANCKGVFTLATASGPMYQVGIGGMHELYAFSVMEDL